MKLRTLLVLSAVAAALQFSSIGYAQSANEPGMGKHGRRAEMLANLSPDERAKLRAAHQKVKSDPALRAARERFRQTAREYRDLRRQKLIEADPSLQPVLNKMQASRRGNI